MSKPTAAAFVRNSIKSEPSPPPVRRSAANELPNSSIMPNNVPSCAPIVANPSVPSKPSFPIKLLNDSEPLAPCIAFEIFTGFRDDRIDLFN